MEPGPPTTGPNNVEGAVTPAPGVHNTPDAAGVEPGPPRNCPASLDGRVPPRPDSISGPYPFEARATIPFQYSTHFFNGVGGYVPGAQNKWT